MHLLERRFANAASEYFHALRFLPTEPLLLLSLGVALISEAAQGQRGRAAAGTKTNVHHLNRAVLTAFAFFHVSSRFSKPSGVPVPCKHPGREALYSTGVQAYARERGPQLHQEAAFNLGRAAQQLGLNHLAHHHYEQALSATPAHCAAAALFGSSLSPMIEDTGSLDLKHEAAHNLVALYRASGAAQLARDVMQRFLAV